MQNTFLGNAATQVVRGGGRRCGLDPLFLSVRLRGGEELVGFAPDHGTGEWAQRVDPPG